MTKRLFSALCAIGSIGAVTFGGWFASESKENAPGRIPDGRQPSAVAVEIAPVERATIRDIRTFTGTLDPSTQFEVAPKIGGRLEVLNVDIGDGVKKGDIIARLDDDEYVLQVEQARAELEVAKADVAEARSSLAAKQRAYQRMKQLRQQKVASESELDAAEAEARAQEARIRLAEAQVAQREAALRAAEVRLSYTTIRAAWQNGDDYRVVGERFVDEGTTISANTPIVSVLNIRELIAVIFVTERDYPRLRIGQAAQIITDSYPGRRFRGEILRTAPLFREASRQARVEVRVANPDGVLKPGMFVRVHVELDVAPEAIVVPLAGLVDRDERTGLFVVDRIDGSARFVPVRVGIVEGERAQIIEPAIAGQVVTLGQHLLDDGAAVIITEDASNRTQAAGSASEGDLSAIP